LAGFKAKGLPSPTINLPWWNGHHLTKRDIPCPERALLWPTKLAMNDQIRGASLTSSMRIDDFVWVSKHVSGHEAQKGSGRVVAI
jgi:hypothetical protein